MLCGVNNALFFFFMDYVIVLCAQSTLGIAKREWIENYTMVVW
jgi:hypothetical protein